MHPIGYVFQQLLDEDPQYRTHLRRRARRTRDQTTARPARPRRPDLT